MTDTKPRDRLLVENTGRERDGAIEFAIECMHDAEQSWRSYLQAKGLPVGMTPPPGLAVVVALARLHFAGPYQEPLDVGDLEQLAEAVMSAKKRQKRKRGAT